MADKETPSDVQAEKVEAHHEPEAGRRGSLRDTMYADAEVRKASIAAMTQNVTGE